MTYTDYDYDLMRKLMQNHIRRSTAHSAKIQNEHNNDFLHCLPLTALYIIFAVYHSLFWNSHSAGPTVPCEISAMVTTMHLIVDELDDDDSKYILFRCAGEQLIKVHMLNEIQVFFLFRYYPPSPQKAMTTLRFEAMLSKSLGQQFISFICNTHTFNFQR